MRAAQWALFVVTAINAVGALLSGHVVVGILLAVLARLVWPRPVLEERAS